jgi:hypothetical protein
MVMTDPNIEYEKLVAEIHQAMLNHDGFENLRVEHNVVIIGRSGAKHQIDVFWEFKAAGMIYRTCVECKNYRSAIKKSHVASFATILDDIGNANGVIATTTSYQQGAKLLAKDKNIRLVLVNYLLKTVHITSHPRVQDFSNYVFRFNEIEVKKLMALRGLSVYDLEVNQPGNYPLMNVAGEAVTSFAQLVRESNITEGHNVVTTAGIYYLSDLGLLPLESFEFNMRYIQMPPTENVIQVNEVSKAVLEDIVSNNIHHLNDDGTVSMKIDSNKKSCL